MVLIWFNESLHTIDSLTYFHLHSIHDFKQNISKLCRLHAIQHNTNFIYRRMISKMIRQAMYSFWLIYLVFNRDPPMPHVPQHSFRISRDSKKCEQCQEWHPCTLSPYSHPVNVRICLTFLSRVIFLFLSQVTIFFNPSCKITFNTKLVKKRLAKV